MKEETTNEKLILQAAEEEFILKGYSGAKTTAIAQKAGVTHAMLHYYFRTKENLFKKVFQEKVQMIASSFEIIFDEALPFEQVIRAFIEKHFDFVMGNAELINFVQNEIRMNKENLVILRKILLSKINYVFSRFEKMIENEVAKGSIKTIKPLDLFMSIITLNLSVSISFSLSKGIGLIKDGEHREHFLKLKKEDNVQYILYSLRR